MRHLLRTCLALTVQTAVEIVRQPLPVLATTLAAALAALFPLFLAFQFGEEGRLARDGILALHFSLGVYLAAVAASSTLGRDLRTGSGALVLSKAVGRDLFYFSKFLGVLLALALFTLCVGLAAVLSVRMGGAHALADSRAGAILGCAILVAYAAAGFLNYRKGRPFASTALLLLVAALAAAAALVSIGPGGGAVRASLAVTAVRLAPALTLVFLALAVMAAMVLALSVRLSATPVVAIGGVVFLLGLVNGPLFGPAAAAGNAAAAAAAALLPDWQHFWVADALSGNGRIPLSYVGWAGLYAAVYAAGALLAGLALFRDREV